MFISNRVPLEVWEKIGGKTKLKYEEPIKRILMMTRKNNVAMRESNDNIDHKNMIIIWISFADEAKFSSIFDTRVYFEPYFWP